MRALNRMLPLISLLAVIIAAATAQSPALGAPSNPPAKDEPAKIAASPATCDQVLQRLWDGKAAYTNDLEFQIAIAQNLTPASSATCGAEFLKAYWQVTDGAFEKAGDLYTPARQGLFTALQNYSTKQQQTSSNSATASVTPVSKVTGLPGIAEEFSGVSVSSGTSALTFQFAPGTLLSNLEQATVLLPCTPALNVDPGKFVQKSGRQGAGNGVPAINSLAWTHTTENGRNCVPGLFNGIAERLTFSVTANTSTAAQSIKGTATSTSSSSSAVPATLANTGSTEPTFGGFGVKGVVFYQPNRGTKTPANEQTIDNTILDTSLLSENDLKTKCPTFYAGLRKAAQDATDAVSTAAKNGSAAAAQNVAFNDAVSNNFEALGQSFEECLRSNPATASDMRSYLASIVAYDAAVADVTRTPLLGFEYDLNAPANQPSYSSYKMNVAYGWGSQKSPQASANCGGTQKSAGQTLACPAAEAALSQGPNTTQGAGPVSPPNNTNAKSTDAAAKSAAGANTQAFTLNISFVGDVYNSEPSSSIPSASHLRDFQGGIELDYIVPSSKIKGIGSLIGDSTLAGSYYYQDQTSPSILTGPPSSITIANLPSTASSVYTARGPINLGQIRYGFGTGTNVSFPIAFTYSNRSELIAHPIKGLQFGISYNLSSLFASAAAKK